MRSRRAPILAAAALILTGSTLLGVRSSSAEPPPVREAPEAPALSLMDVAAPALVAAAPLPPPPPPNEWHCPVDGPVSFVDSFGARRRGHRHQGVDMMAATGTPVVAPVAGLVEHRDNRVGGLSFHLHGMDGNYYYGTHLSAYGQSGAVLPGTVIGYVGDSGNARGIPHLHFEIHPGGMGAAAMNPTPVVLLACGGG